MNNPQPATYMKPLSTNPSTTIRINIKIIKDLDTGFPLRVTLWINKKSLSLSTPKQLNPSTPQPLNPSTPKQLNPSTSKPLNSIPYLPCLRHLGLCASHHPRAYTRGYNICHA